MPPGVGYKKGPTKKTRTVARIAKAKNISRAEANVIRKKRKANPTKKQVARAKTRVSNTKSVAKRAKAINEKNRIKKAHPTATLTGGRGARKK